MTHSDTCEHCGYNKVLLDRVQQIKQDQDTKASAISMDDTHRLLLYISKLEARQIPCGWICHP